MIFELVMNVFYNVFRVLTTPIDIPPLPDQVHEIMSNIMEYLTTGLSILGVFCDVPFLLILFGIVIYVEISLLVYKITMWVIRKVPGGFS